MSLPNFVNWAKNNNLDFFVDKDNNGKIKFDYVCCKVCVCVKSTITDKQLDDLKLKLDAINANCTDIMGQGFKCLSQFNIYQN
jgi:hypothetical protein